VDQFGDSTGEFDLNGTAVATDAAKG